jgi:hypothetical protein
MHYIQTAPKVNTENQTTRPNFAVPTGIQPGAEGGAHRVGNSGWTLRFHPPVSRIANGSVTIIASVLNINVEALSAS